MWRPAPRLITCTTSTTTMACLPPNPLHADGAFDIAALFRPIARRKARPNAIQSHPTPMDRCAPPPPFLGYTQA
jgi:hypothetical protein